MALGVLPVEIMGMILRQVFSLVCAGIAAGLVAAIGGAHAMKSFAGGSGAV
jgi:hypothetical protein